MNMFKKLIELRQQKAEKVAEMRSMLEKAEKENRSLNETESVDFEKLKDLVKQMTDEISKYETVADEERSLDAKTKQVEQRNMKQFSNDELRHYVKTGELRNLTTANGEDGGYSVIPQLDKDVMKRLTDDSVMRQLCNVVRLPVGAKEYKKLVSAGGAAVEHGTEGTARNGTATPKLHEVTIALNSIYAYPKTTQEILDFSSIDVLGWLTDEITETFTETEEVDLTSGDGNKKSKGLLTYERTTENDKVRPFGKLQKITASGKGAGKTNRAHRRFRPRIAHAHHLHRGHAGDDGLRQLRLRDCRRAKTQAILRRLLHRVDNPRMCMANNRRAK